MIIIPLWLMTFISTCFAIPMWICAKRGWSFEEKGDTLFTGFLTSLSSAGIMLALLVFVNACIVYISPFIPEILVIP